MKYLILGLIILGVLFGTLFNVKLTQSQTPSPVLTPPGPATTTPAATSAPPTPPGPGTTSPGTTGLVSPPSILRGATDLSTWVTTLVNLLATVAGIVAVFFLIFAGYRYIAAGGNPEQATEAKTAILNAIIGIVVILIAWALVLWLLNRLVGTTQLQI